MPNRFVNLIICASSILSSRVTPQLTILPDMFLNGCFTSDFKDETLRMF